MLWRNLQIKVLPQVWLHELLLKFDLLSESMKLWIAFFEKKMDFLNFWFGVVE